MELSRDGKIRVTDYQTAEKLADATRASGPLASAPSLQKLGTEQKLWQSFLRWAEQQGISASSLSKEDKASHFSAYKLTQEGQIAQAIVDAETLGESNQELEYAALALIERQKDQNLQDALKNVKDRLAPVSEQQPVVKAAEGMHMRYLETLDLLKNHPAAVDSKANPDSVTEAATLYFWKQAKVKTKKFNPDWHKHQDLTGV